ncbi:cysteine-rich perinuclear theca 12 [Microtus ochrogaster]|uniref:Cysteine-rich perinuclear theca 12 n=1 Tax=Microtus ochrogaster TaxID=79684 RepID=A0A8J6KK75_MICOH|nr:cysteine-rich perinuclear theca 12 [Microtus ochrogaster]
MGKVPKKPPEPSADATPSTLGLKMKKKQRKTAPHPKHSSVQKTQCRCYCHQTVKITMKKKPSLRRNTRGKASRKAIQIRIPKEPSETALALLIEETGEEYAKLSAPKQSQPGLDSSHTCVEDLTSSKTQGTNEDPKNTNA